MCSNLNSSETFLKFAIYLYLSSGGDFCISVLGLHRLAPWAVETRGNVIVPVLPNRALVADLAVDGVRLHERHASDDARLIRGLALVADEVSLVRVGLAVLAAPHGKR